MLYAKDGLEATETGQRSTCPHCGEVVISKCGDFKIHHWAHLSNSECGGEPETPWHKEWKNLAKKYDLKNEVRGIRHITDSIDFENKICFEFQHSPINTMEIYDRNNEYFNLDFKVKWIFDYKDKYYSDHLVISIKDDYITWKQKWAKKNILNIHPYYFEENCIFFDAGTFVILVKKLYDNGNGWGYIKEKDFVFQEAKNDMENYKKYTDELLVKLNIKNIPNILPIS